MPFKEVIRWVKISGNAEMFREKIPEQKIMRITVGKKDICLTRYGLQVYAFENRCPHQLVPLNNGSCTEDKMVVCPWHRFAFSLENGRGAGLYMEVYPVKEEQGALFIGFKSTVFSLFR